MSLSSEENEIRDEESWPEYESLSTDASELHESEHGKPQNKCCDCWTQACPQINEQLLVFKAFNFFFFAAVGSLFPYLSVFYKQIWLTARETGILLGMRPLVQLVATPMWGMITDTYNRGKLIFIISLVAWLVSNYSLSLVSPVRHLGLCRDNETIGLAEEVSAARKHGSKHHGEGNDSVAKLNISNASHRNILESTFHSFLPQQGDLGDLKEAFEKMKRSLTKPEELNEFNSTRTVMRHTNTSAQERGEKARDRHITKVSRQTGRAEVLTSGGASLVVTPRKDRAHSSPQIQMRWVDASDAARDLKRETTEREFDFLNMEGHYPWPLDMVANYAETQGSLEWQTSNQDRHLFTLLFLVTFIGNVIAAPAVTLADTATLQALGDFPEDYGKQRLWGAFGWGLGAFIVGASLNTIQEVKNCNNPLSVDYMPCFYAFAFLMGIALLVGALFEFRACHAKDDVNVLAGIKSFCSCRYVYFILTVLHCGSALGFIEVFLFWHLEDLGGTQLLFSIITVLHCISEVVVYRWSGRLIKRFGHHTLIYAGLTCYAIRFFVYALIQSSWVVLPFELLHGITTAAVWSAAVTYVGLISGAPTTMQGTLGSVHWSLGGGGGGIVGGFLVSYVGAARSFSIFGVLTVVDLLLFILVNNCKLICPPNEPSNDRNL